MLSTSISALLFALLVVVLQILTAVSVLPASIAATSTITGTPTTNTSTSTVTMNTSAQPQRGRASGSNWNSNNNNRGYRNTAPRPPPNSTNTSREFAVRAMLSWFYKRDNSENQEHNNYVMSLAEILAIVIAALTLLVAMIPLFRCSRFHRWVSSSISPLFRKAPGITPPNPVSAPVTTIEGLSAVPAPEIPIPRPVLIYNDYSNAHFLGACSNTFLYNKNGITGEDGRVLQPEELLAPRRPERTLTYPLT